MDTSTEKPTKTAKKCKPTNHPDRDDWSVLSKLLKRPVSPEGLNEDEAAELLKELLKEAYGVSCEKMVVAACSSRANSQGSYLQSIFRMLNIGRHPRRRADFFETVQTRLLLPEDGRDRPISKANLAKARPSSYNMLDYWEPKLLGILPYVRERVSHIISQVGKEMKEKNMMESYDAIQGDARLHIGSDGIGHISSLKAHTEDAYGDADAQELHDSGEDAFGRSSLEDDELAASDLAHEDGEGEDSLNLSSLKREDMDEGRLDEAHPSVLALNKILDSVFSDTRVNSSPLAEPGFVEQLGENDVTIHAFTQMQNMMAEPGAKESPEEMLARIEAEVTVASELVSNMGGLSRFPSDTAARMSEALNEVAPDIDEDENLSVEEDEAEPAKTGKKGKTVGKEISEPGNQDERAKLDYTFSQARKQLGTFSKSTRPEYNLFSLVLGENIVPAESPESRNIQLSQLAMRIATEKCFGMNSEANSGIAEGIETEVATWLPGCSSFGRMFPDVLDYLQTDMIDDLASKERDKLFSPQPPTKTVHVEQMALELTAVRNRTVTPHYRELRTVQDIISTPAFHEAFAVGSVVDTEFWTATCRSPSQLDTPDRVDYQFLCAKCNVKPDHLIEPEQLHEEIRCMSIQWVDGMISARNEARSLAQKTSLDVRSPSDQILEDFDDALREKAASFNPAEDGFFSQAINEFLRDQLEEEIVRKDAQRIARIKAKVAKKGELSDPASLSATSGESYASDQQLLSGKETVHPLITDDIEDEVPVGAMDDAAKL